MALSQLIIVDIVCRCDLQTARTELRIYIGVGNHGNLTLGQRHDDALPDQITVAPVIRVDTDSSICQYRLRTERCNHYTIVSSTDAGTHMVDSGLNLLVDHLFIGEGGLCGGVPVDHPDTAIDIALLIEVDKTVYHRIVPLLVERKACPLPVA